MSGTTQTATRTVVTGLGVVAPNGVGLDAYWDATLTGRSGLRRLTRFDPSQYPVQHGGEVLDFTPKPAVPGRLMPQTDRVTQFSLAATGWALDDAALDLAALGLYDVGIVTSNACGGYEFGHRELQKLWSDGPHRVSAYQSFAWFYAVNTGQLSIRHNVRGHSSVVVTEQAGGLDALNHARRLLRNGTLKVAIAGGMEAPLCPWGLTGQIPTGRLSRAGAYLPFHRAASGYLPGEGGAMLTIEDAEGARSRGAHVYGELAGYAATFDPAPGTGRPSALPRAIRGALDDARLEPADVDVVLADAGGLPELDTTEARAISEVFGPRGVPVAAPKSLTGRLYSGGGPLDVTTALLMIRDGVIPAVPYESDIPDEYEIDLVAGEPRRHPVRNTLVIARGNGGFNSALVVRAA
ncbi:ketosynthase chain-length factor [Nonomuraea sp. NBC_00507]|uniref:ketosynthase chain-length factor n=1 Tax=Nonomuraea sp. NBC_00507 TaxID=2976002 RepID=UPI002E1760A4